MEKMLCTSVPEVSQRALNTCSVCLEEADELHIFKGGFLCEECFNYIIENC